MDNVTLTALIPVLQTAIGPVILISGIGLLLLSMTNRLGRAIDRARDLATDLPTANEKTQSILKGQIRILWRRAQLIRIEIMIVTSSALFAATLVLEIFFAALFNWAAQWLIGTTFCLCILSLIAGLVLFIYDINWSLGALKIELKVDEKNSIKK